MKEAIRSLKIKLNKNFTECLQGPMQKGPAQLVRQVAACKSPYSFFKFLRKELQTSDYQSQKYDESNPSVQFLHQLSVAVYTELDLFSCYQPLEADFLKKFPDSDRTVSYFLRHPKIIWQSKLSTWFGRTLTSLAYDPKLYLDNLPGKLFDFAQDVRLIYTPTPTHRLDVVPEAHALLQALQNGTHGYRGWAYVNLQDLTSGDERRRSLNIMRLEDAYPDTFFGMTLAQDVGIYRHDFRDALLSKKNFTLNSPFGYYFPAKTHAEQQEWQDALNEIITRAMSIQSTNEARRELINLEIILFFLRKVKTRPLVFAASCKESIDRGGKINALLYFLKTGDLATARILLHARAAHIRERQIRKRRSLEFEALIASDPDLRLRLDLL